MCWSIAQEQAACSKLPRAGRKINWGNKRSEKIRRSRKKRSGREEVRAQHVVLEVVVRWASEDARQAVRKMKTMGRGPGVGPRLQDRGSPGRRERNEASLQAGG
eukprot:10579184-Heterocapsa_arctica.AAC.1